MSDLHACPLCGYARDAQHVTVLDPRCPACGGILEPAVRLPPAAATPLARLTDHRIVVAGLAAMVVLPLLVAAGKLGWTAGGPGLSAVALVLAALIAYVALAPATHR